MTAWLARLLGGSAGTLLTPGEVLLIIVLGAAFLFLFVTGVLASGALILRARKEAREHTRADRFRMWQKALHSVLYDGASRDALWLLVDESSAIDFLHFLVEYVRRLHGSERAEVCVLAEPHLPRILHYLNHRAEGRRMRTVQMLGELGLPKYAPAVIASLDDPSDMVAMVAASTLARAETVEYAAEVLARLDRFAHWRQDFLVAMVGSMGAGASEALRATLTDENAPSKVRAVAADALASVSDPAAADPAWEVLRASDDIEVRAASIRLLANVGRAKHLDAVRAELTSPDLPVRLAAIRALGRFGLAVDLPPLDDAARSDPSPWVAIAAARALKEGGGDHLLQALAGSTHSRAALGLQVISEARSW